MDKLRLLVERFASPVVGSRLTKQELCLGFSAIHKLLSTTRFCSKSLPDPRSTRSNEVRCALQSTVLANRIKRLTPGCSLQEIAMLAEGWSVLHWNRWDVVDHLVLSFYQLYQKQLQDPAMLSKSNLKKTHLQFKKLFELSALVEASVASSHYVNATLSKIVEDFLVEFVLSSSFATVSVADSKEIIFRFLWSACSYLGVKKVNDIVNCHLPSLPSTSRSGGHESTPQSNNCEPRADCHSTSMSVLKEFMNGMTQMHSGSFQQLQRNTLDRQAFLHSIAESNEHGQQRTFREGARLALYSWWSSGMAQISGQMLKEYVTLFIYHGFQDIILHKALEEAMLAVIEQSLKHPEERENPAEEEASVILRGLSEAVYKRPEAFPKVREVLATKYRRSSSASESLQTQRAVCLAFDKAIEGIAVEEETISRISGEFDLYTADERAMALMVLSMTKKLPAGLEQTLLGEVSALSVDGLAAIFFSLQFDTTGLHFSICEAAMQHMLDASSLQGVSFKTILLIVKALSQPISRFVAPSVSFLTVRQTFIESVVQLLIDRVHSSVLSVEEMLEIGVHMCGVDNENTVLHLICQKIISFIKRGELMSPHLYVDILHMLMKSRYLDEELLDAIAEPLTVFVVRRGIESCCLSEASLEGTEKGDHSELTSPHLLLLRFALYQSVFDAPALYPSAQLITSVVLQKRNVSSSVLLAAGLLEQKNGNTFNLYRILARLEEAIGQDSKNNFSLEMTSIPFALHLLYRADGFRPSPTILTSISRTLELYITGNDVFPLPLVSPADIARFIVVIGRNQDSEERLSPASSLLDYCSRAVLSLSSTLYTAISTVLGKFKSCEPLTTEMVESLPQVLNRLSSEQISTVIFGFGQIPDAGLLLAHQLSADVASDYVVDNSELFYSGKCIARMLHGFSLLHITKRTLYAVFSERLSARAVLSTMDRVSISLAMSAFGTAKFLHKGLFDKFSRSFVDHAKGLSSADLLLSIKAMSRVMLLDHHFYSSMGDEVSKKTDDLSIRAQCDLLHAYGAVDLPHHQLAETITSNISARVGELPDANAACAVLVSLTRMGYNIRENQNVNLIADYITSHVDELSCHSTAAICAVLEEADWKHTPMLKALAEHSVSLKKNEEMTSECSRGVLDLLAKNLIHHPLARNELTPLARAASKDAVLLSEDEALEHQLLIASFTSTYTLLLRYVKTFNLE